ncbi:glycosyltransferase family 2 protein [Leeuwenhoekiella aestuarii]|uniref:Glycosyltransferase n=1 Tax=Leeuwenhoekiella aestuarii TaxID=2249426 RepID=A0A4Q0NRR6_9FLAO|nr:glycosyltransferase family 2 protein [Leeuwenhoekiella aestuarii]RXG13104.1 glycosyltransferase [Leeuwenhoekiella aestuarii]
MKISVITIVYNNKATIASCIEAVSSQDYPDVEHIVIDGGSTDGTREIIESYRDRLGYYVSEPDKGLYNALNKGIRAATGAIIGILHSDDFYPKKSTLSEIAQAFQSSGADMVYGNGMFVNREQPDVVKRIYKAKPFQPRYLKYGWVPLHTTIYVKKEVFETYGLYEEDYRIASDYEITLRWLSNPQIKTHFVNDWLVKMRLGGKSTTAALQQLKSTEDLQIIKRYPLWGILTLAFKIGRKIPQYLLPRFKKFE